MTPFDLTRHRKTLEKEMESLQRHVMAGGPSSFEEYKHKIGQFKGLNKALELIQDTLKQMDAAE